MGTVKYTGPVASFHCPTNAEIRSLKVHFSPKQEGTGDPSPENVREIVGWDGVEVYRNTSTTNYEFGVLGKNKFNKNDSEKIISGLQILSSEKIGGSSTSTTVFVPCQPNTTYTISKLVTARAAISYAITDTIPQINDSIYGYQNIANQSTATIATGDNAKWLCIYITNTNYDSTSVQDILDSLQVELGSSATAYEPYNPNYIVYGGWVDLISGEACEEWNAMYLKNLPGDWNYNSNNVRFQITLPSQSLNGPTGTWNNKNIMSEAYQTSISNGYGNKQIAQYSNRYIYIRDNDFEGDVEAFLSAVGDTKIVYKLPTATTYSLSPTSMQTFLGQNNVWSNADYVEVEYDLHETQDILAHKQFIIANQPHLVSPVAAPLQNFVTDMVAPLKECKVYFSPVQEGSGDASPENVRDISGWNGIKLWTSGKNMLPDWKSIYVNRRQNGETFNGITYSFTDNGFQLTGTATTSGKANLGGSGKENAFIENNSPILKGGYSYIISYNKTGSLLNGGSGQVENRSGWIQPGYAFELTKDGRAWLYHSLTTEEGLTYNEKIEDVQLELGSIATDYEPYNGTTIPIDWTAEAGTIYGGYVDLVNREVAATHQIKILNGTENEWNIYQHPTYGDSFWIAQSGKKIEQLLSISDKYKNVAICYGKSGQDKYGVFCDHETLNRWYFRAPNNTVTTLNEWKEWLSQNNIIIAYQLATPITYQLTPSQLKTLRGINNIWSNTNGNIELKYWAH